jgi:hypothetical protein
MSWTFGGLLIKKNYTGKLDEFLALTWQPLAISESKLSLYESVLLKGQQAAVGVVNECTVLFNEGLPYDCSFDEGEESDYDKQLAAASMEATILVFLLDGISGTYGYSIFNNGKRVRRWAADPRAVLCDEGEVMEFENRGDNEERVFASMEYYLKTPFATLFRDNEKIFYKTTA